MAGRSKKTTEPPLVIPSNSLVASAVRYPGKAARIYRPSEGWQVDAYRHYSICGEARFAANFFGNSLSKATLFAAESTPNGVTQAADDSESAQILGELFNGSQGQAQMLASIGIHLTVGGECFLVGRKATGDIQRDGYTPAGQDIWEIVSPLEMVVAGTQWMIRYSDGLPDVLLEEDDVVIRIWRPHPAKRIEADSPFRSLLPILGEIEWLTLHIFAQCRSRLAGAGVLWVPQGVSFPPPPPGPDGQPQELSEASSFMLSLGDAMMTPISDPSSPAAVIPYIATIPDDMVGKAELMHFWSPLDEASLKMREAAIHRFALGMDLPPEQVLGMGSSRGAGGGSSGVSHWGAWQIDEQTIKLHVDPMLETVVNALTVGYLRPLLTDANSTSVVSFSSAKLRLRPDRSKEAMELYDRGAIKTSVMVEENGFTKDDMPDPDEFRTWLLTKVASGSATPDQVGAALALLGIKLDVPPQDSAQTRDSRPTPTLIDHPTRKEPDIPGASPELVAACEGLMYQALQRAGNRLRQKVGQPPNCPAWATHTMVQANGTTDMALADAFPAAEFVLDGIADHTQVVPILEAYARTLLKEQSPHDRERMTEWLVAGIGK